MQKYWGDKGTPWNQFSPQIKPLESTLSLLWGEEWEVVWSDRFPLGMDQWSLEVPSKGEGWPICKYKRPISWSYWVSLASLRRWNLLSSVPWQVLLSRKEFNPEPASSFWAQGQFLSFNLKTCWYIGYLLIYLGKSHDIHYILMRSSDISQTALFFFSASDNDISDKGICGMQLLVGFE